VPTLALKVAHATYLTIVLPVRCGQLDPNPKPYSLELGPPAETNVSLQHAIFALDLYLCIQDAYPIFGTQVAVQQLVAAICR
jgi:hypothetical protein